MLIKRSLLAAVVIGGFLSTPPAAGQSARQTTQDQPVARNFETAGTGTFGGSKIKYRAGVEEYFAPDQSGKPGASIFLTSYVQTANAASNRPVIFAFNGGPGSASIWLHLGFLGPKRVDLDNHENPGSAAPFRLVANTDSPLDVADIVLIDPPGTGYSEILPSGKPEQFFGVTQDARAVGAVIEQWLRRHGRLNSPKFLISESYGTTRAAALAKLVAGGPTETGVMTGITFNGIIMLGQAMDYSVRGPDGDDRTSLQILPSLAATACYFGKVAKPCSPQSQVDAAQAFNENVYARALYKGSRLSPEEKLSVAEGLSKLTGLPVDAITRENLRVSGSEFASMLLENDGRRLGMYDSRYTLPTVGQGRDPVADDPAMGQYVPGYIAAFDKYARDDLKISFDKPYVAISFRSVNARWDYGLGPGIPAIRNFAVDLAAAMNRNQSLRLMIATGYYDLVTPLGAATDTVAHAGIPLDRTVFHQYESGHMPYLGREPRAQLAADVRAFVKGN